MKKLCLAYWVVAHLVLLTACSEPTVDGHELFVAGDVPAVFHESDWVVHTVQPAEVKSAEELLRQMTDLSLFQTECHYLLIDNSVEMKTLRQRIESLTVGVARAQTVGSIVPLIRIEAGFDPEAVTAMLIYAQDNFAGGGIYIQSGFNPESDQLLKVINSLIGPSSRRSIQNDSCRQ